VDLHDLTEERIRTALEEIEARLRLSQEVGTWDWDLVTNKLHWSELQCRQFGIDPAMGDGVDREIWRKSVHPGDLAPSEAALEKVIEDGVYFTFEYRIIRSGEVRWMNAHGHVFRDSSRKPVRVIGMDIDITERKRAEEAAARLAAIVTTSSDAIISKALDGTVVTWNEAAARLFGYGEEEMVGQPIRRLIPEHLQKEEDGILARIAAGGPVQNYETLRLHKDGRLVEVSVAISPIRDAAGKVTGASKIARDITERKQAEAALRESE
jgi:two-component system, OmpR family, sensor histidine kinase VicK